MTGSRPRHLQLVLAALLLVSGVGATVCGTSAEAQERSAVSSVDRTAVRTGETLNYTLRMSAKGNEKMAMVEQPKFGPFEVLGTSQGSEMRSGGGSFQFIRSVSARLRATKAGKFAITAPTVRIGDKVVKGNPVEVTVLERGAALPKGKPAAAEAMLRVIPSEVRPYVGQQVLIEYALYIDRTRVGPFGAEVTDATEPSFDGFWIEDLTKSLTGSTRNEVLGGREYSVQPIKLLAVFPLNAGVVEINPMQVEVNVGRRMLRRHSARIASDSVELDVRALPQPAPDGFQGANVGRYTLEVTTDKRKVAVGEPLALRITVKGSGMVSRVMLPKLPKMDNFKTLEPVVSKDTRLTRRSVGGEKSAEIVLTPLATGVYDIPPIVFHYFDPSNEEYKSVSSKPITIGVAGDWGKNEQDEDLIERMEADVPKAVEVARRPLHPVRVVANMPTRQAPSRPAYAHPLFLLGLLLPPFGYSGWILFGLYRRRREQKSPQRQRQTAPRRAHERLRKATEVAKAGRGTEAIGEVAAAMTDVFAQWMGVPPGAVTSSRIRRFLSEHGADPSLVTRIEELRATCDQARFGGLEAERVEETTNEASTILAALTDLLGSKQ